MSDYIGVVTSIGQAKIAAAIGGTALNLTTIRVGDGNGAPITPNPAMTDLVRRVGVAYPIISSGRDPVNANHWRITTVIPVADGPFDIREIGVWDAAGDMIAIAKHVLVEKRSPAQGAAVELLTDIVFPVSETAQVTVQVTPSAQISIFQMLRAGFTVVESATLANPPAAPALGRTHVVPAGSTGAWNGLAGYLVQWNGIVWVAVDVPSGFVVVDQSRPTNHASRYLRRDPAGWVSAAASEAAYGVTQIASLGETILGVEAGKAVSPANLKEWAAPRERRPGFSVVDGIFNAPPPGPAEYTTVLVGPAPTGAFALSANQLATFFANGWRFLEVPVGHILVNASQAEGSPGRFLRRVAAGTWVNGEASETAYGPVRLASSAEALAAAADRVLTAQRADEVFARRLRNISAGVGLTGGGNLTADRSLAVDLAMLDARYTINGPLVAAMVFNTGASVWGGVQVVSGTPYGGTWNQATNTFTFTTPRPNTSYFIEGNVQASRFVENGTTNEHVPVVEPLESGDIATKTVNSFTMTAPVATGTDSSNKRRLRLFYFLRVFGYS